MPPTNTRWLNLKVFGELNGRISTYSILGDGRISTCRTLSSKPPKTWQERVESLAETFSPPLPLSESEQDELSGILQSLLNKGVIKDSTDKTVKNHFQGLLNGLQMLAYNNTSSPSSVKSLLPLTERERVVLIDSLPVNSSTASTLISTFDELFYNGELSRRIASLILKHQTIASVEQINHIAKLIFNGGSGLRKWSLSDKYTFRLQIANKFWNIGQREKAKELIVEGFDNIWEPALEKRVLKSHEVLGYGKALIVSKRKDLLEKMLNKWNYETFNSVGSSSIASTSPAFPPAPPPPPQSSLLSFLFLPLWKAAISCNEFELSQKIIEKGLSCSIHPALNRSQMEIDPVLLYTYTLSTLYKHSKLDNNYIKQLITTKIRKIPPPFQTSNQTFYKTTIYNLMDLCSMLSLSSSPSHRFIALEMLAYFEEFTKNTLKLTDVDDRTRAILPAKLSLLQLNLSNSTQKEEIGHIPEIIT